MRFNIILILIITSSSLNGQVSFYGKSDEIYSIKPSKFTETQKWGLEDGNGNWIVTPIYNHPGMSYKDSLFIFINDLKKAGVIDNTGDTIIDFVNYSLFFSVDTSKAPFDIMSFPLFFNGKVNFRPFKVDKQGHCISIEYYPCPYGSTRSALTDDNDSTLFLIELADKYLFLDSVNFAIDCYKKAIEINPKNPFVYYWISQSLVYNEQFANIDYRNPKIIDNSFFIKECIDKAIELEPSFHYQIRLKRILFLFYKHIEGDENSADNILLWYKENKKLNKHDKLFSYWWKIDYNKSDRK